MTMPSKTKSGSLLPARGVRAFHKITGLCLILPVLLLVVTGLPLELTDQLNLGTRGVPFQFVHKSYGVDTPESAWVQNNVVQLGELLFIKSRVVPAKGALLAAHDASGFHFILMSQEWLLIPEDTEIPFEQGDYPGQILRAGFAAGLPMIETREGTLTSQDYGASWESTSLKLKPSAVPLPLDVNEEMRRAYGASIISWERWLQDLHSGRYFGPIGQWVMIVAGIALIGLALTGFLVWFRTLRR